MEHNSRQSAEAVFTSFIDSRGREIYNDQRAMLGLVYDIFKDDENLLTTLKTAISANMSVEILQLLKLSDAERQFKMSVIIESFTDKHGIERQRVLDAVRVLAKGIGLHGLVLSDTKNKQENENSIEQLMKKANEGDAEAAFELVWHYFDGEKGVNKNPAKSLEWMNIAAILGHKKAMTQILTLLSRDEYSHEHGGLFLQWLKKLADDKNPTYMIELAAIYCCERDNPFIEKFKYYQGRGIFKPHDGLRLFDEAIIIAERNNDAMLSSFYNRAASAYNEAKNRLKVGDPLAVKIENPISGHPYIDLLSQNVWYNMKAFGTNEKNPMRERFDEAQRAEWDRSIEGMARHSLGELIALSGQEYADAVIRRGGIPQFVGHSATF